MHVPLFRHYHILTLLPLASTATSPSSPPTSPPHDSVPPDFVSRVSSLPLVGTALRAYEQGKASSRVVKVRLFLFSVSPFLIGPCATVWRRNDGVLRQGHLSARHRAIARRRQPVG